MMLLKILFFILSTIINHSLAAKVDDTYVAGTGSNKDVRILTSKNFGSAIADPDNTLWLLKFYAPWCGHCKKFAPVLDEIAPELEGIMSIGKIDCTKEKQLCNQYNVRGYPTLKVARDGHVIGTFPGSRTPTSIKSYATKMTLDNPIIEIHNFNDIIKKLKTTSDNDESDDDELPDYNIEENGIAFILYEPSIVKNFNTNMTEKLSSTTLTKAFQKAVRKKQYDSNYGMLTFVEPSSIANDGILQNFVTKKQLDDVKKYGFVAKIEKSKNYKRHVYIPSTSSSSDDDINKIEKDIINFIDNNKYPTVINLKSNNFRNLAMNDNGKELVIGVINEPTSSDNDNDNKKVKKTNKFKERMITNLGEYAINSPSSLGIDKYYFTIINYGKFSNFMKQYNVTEYPQILVINAKDRTYYQNITYGGKDMITKSLQGGENPVKIFLINGIHNGILKQKSLDDVADDDYVGQILKLFNDYLPYSLLVVVFVLFGIIFLIVECISPPNKELPPHIKKNIPRVPDEPLTTIVAEQQEQQAQADAAKESKKDK